MRTPASRLAAPALLLALFGSACSDGPTVPVPPAPLEARPGSGGGGSLQEDFDVWDSSRWATGTHVLGLSQLRAENVSVQDGHLLLRLPANTREGAEILTRHRVRYGVYEARIRAAALPGTLTTFFLYQGVSGGNDEIDIEIFGDGSGIMFTTWVRGRATNHLTTPLPFDPTADFHVYRIEFERRAVRFRVDGVLMAEFTSGIPNKDMYLMANAWWPTWLSGAPLPVDRAAAYDWIRY